MKASRAPGSKARKKNSATPRKKNRGLVSQLAADKQLLAAVALVVVVFLVYANSLGNDFVFDDIYLVQFNQRLRTLDLPLLLSSYRPLRDVSYAIDIAIWGEGPFGFHLTNMLIHAGNVLLVFALVRRLSEDLISAVLAALIFAVHPIQTDAVTYISGRRDLLFTFFYLAAFHTYLAYYRARWSFRTALYSILFLVFWALSLMSKEMAASLPLVIFVWHYCEAWEGGPNLVRQVLKTLAKTFSRDRWFWVALFLGGVAFTAYSVLLSGASQRARNLEYWGGSFYLNFLTVVRVHAWYLKQLVFPTPITQYLGAFDISNSILDWSFALSSVVVGAVLCAGFLLLKRDKLMAFAVLSYFVMLLPVSHIIPHHELLADHYLYLPMMGFGLFMALLVRKISLKSPTASRAVYIVAGSAVLILAVMTVMQNRVWKNERTLWTANYKAVPRSPRAALNLGNTYQDTDPDKAAELYKRALGLNPTPLIRRTLYDRLAVILIHQKKFDEAEFFVADVLSKAPNDFFGNLWASQIHMATKRCSQAGAELSLAESVAASAREATLATEARRDWDRLCKQAPKEEQNGSAAASPDPKDF